MLTLQKYLKSSLNKHPFVSLSNSDEVASSSLPVRPDHVTALGTLARLSNGCEEASKQGD